MSRRPENVRPLDLGTLITPPGDALGIGHLIPTGDEIAKEGGVPNRDQDLLCQREERHPPVSTHVPPGEEHRAMRPRQHGISSGVGVPRRRFHLSGRCRA